MSVIIFFVVICAIYYLWIKLSPNHSAMMKVKFDYVNKKTAFYSKFKVIMAVLFWLFILLVGVAVSDAQTTITVLGVITAIYAFFIIRYLNNQRKFKEFKKNATKIPGKIVGVKIKKGSYDYDRHSRHTIIYLIVEYENPYTHQKEEYVTPAVNGGPIAYLKSLDVSVYYQDAEHIWVDDFKRIKKLRDNIAYQMTGSIEGKVPGLLRYERM